MVTCVEQKGYYFRDSGFIPDSPENRGRLAAIAKKLPDAGEMRKQTMTYGILNAHNHSGDDKKLGLKFDALASPDNNYVSILQTVRAVGIEQYPVPYILSNCHNTLCCVGGTMNADDHAMGLDCAKKYGGIYLPPYSAVIHQYMREAVAACGSLVLASDSHTRYGALGCMGIGEGGGEVAKQLLGRLYDLPYPPVIAVRLIGEPRPGVGPMDVALALIAKVYGNSFIKNKVLEFVGEDLHRLSVEYRIGIDVMTTEAGALSSVWETDQKVKQYFAVHGQEEAYCELRPADGAYYDGYLEINLSQIPSMIALPFHPGNAYPVAEFLQDAPALLQQAEQQGNALLAQGDIPFRLQDKYRDGSLFVQQALVSGCAGGMFENIAAMADILEGYTIPGDGTGLFINPASQPMFLELMRQGIAAKLVTAGAVMRPAVCGPCFGVSDTPVNGELSARHVTRNFANREGSRPQSGQMAAVALMDARTIAATVRAGGKLTGGDSIDVTYHNYCYKFDKNSYEKQIFNGYGNPQQKIVPRMGPNITDWPEMQPLPRHLLLQVAGAYDTPVGTDDLLPSGEASSYRSNPHKLAEYTLMNRDSRYVGRAKSAREQQQAYRNGDQPADARWQEALEQAVAILGSPEGLALGSIICATQIGDGSSREQAASCQRVLGGWANLAQSYATKRYRSNLVNWGMLPICADPGGLQAGDFLLLRGIRQFVLQGEEEIECLLLRPQAKEIPAILADLEESERDILLAGGLINAYKAVESS